MTTSTTTPADPNLIAPRPNPARGALCKCGQIASIVLQGAWFPDGQSRAYCTECHARGTWRLHAALRIQESEDARRQARRREILRTIGATLATGAVIWGLGWLGGSDHPTVAGEMPLWHWLVIVPMGALGWFLVDANCDEVDPQSEENAL